MALTAEEIKAIIAGAISGSMGSGAGTTSSAQAIKLTEVSAKQLLDSIAADIQYTGKFTKAELAAFVAAYNKKANEQLETVVKTVKESSGGTTTGKEATAAITSILSTSFPNFFDPKQFTKDYIWGKVNFGETATLGAKSLEALQTARGIAKDFNLSNYSEIEIQTAAKKIAKGELTQDQYKAQLAQIAKLEYPQLAARFDSTPGATTRQLYSPIINAVANVWEVDPSTLDINDPFIDSLVRPDGVTGKLPSKSVGEATQLAMMHVNFDKTKKANDAAAQGATSFARALGWGV